MIDGVIFAAERPMPHPPGGFQEQWSRAARPITAQGGGQGNANAKGQGTRSLNDFALIFEIIASQRSLHNKYVYDCMLEIIHKTKQLDRLLVRHKQGKNIL